MNLINEFRLNFDSYDPWGSSMAMHFAICDELYYRGEDIPHEWRYSPGAFCDSDPRNKETYEFELCEQATSEELLYLGTILERYENLLKKHGKDY